MKLQDSKHRIENDSKKSENEKLFAHDPAGQFLSKISLCAMKRSAGVICLKETTSCMKLLTTRS